MPLNRLSSKTIVNELHQVLGKAAVLVLLEVTETRFNALAGGRGSLKDAQLTRITDQTGRSWMRWAVDALARGPRTAQERELDRATYELLDEIDPVKNKRSKTIRPAVLPIHRAPKSTQRQAV